MADVKYYDVILKPVVTEKSMNAMTEKKYTFLVHTDATKNQIKEAVEKMFEGTKVERVNTMNQDGKNRRRGMVVGKTSKTKKAIVTLTADSKDIEIFEGLESLSLIYMLLREHDDKHRKEKQQWELKYIIHIPLPEDI